MERVEMLRVLAVWDGAEVVQWAPNKPVYVCRADRSMCLLEELDYDRNMEELWRLAKMAVEQLQYVIIGGARVPDMARLYQQAYRDIALALVKMDVGRLFAAVYGAVALLCDVKTPPKEGGY